MANDKGEVTLLKRRVAELERKLGLSQPEPVAKPAPFNFPDSLNRDANGQPIPVEGVASYEDRQIPEVKRREAQYEADQKRMTKGLPAGFFRDPTGLIRNREGKIAQIIEMMVDGQPQLFNSDGSAFEGEQEPGDVAAVGRAQRREHKVWLREQGLPVRTAADDD